MTKNTCHEIYFKLKDLLIWFNKPLPAVTTINSNLKTVITNVPVQSFVSFK